MEFKSNGHTAILRLKHQLESIAQENAVLKEVAVAMLPVVRVRIHQDGLDAQGNPIGTYSKGYMAVRTGQYIGNGVYLTGKNKGTIRTNKAAQKLKIPAGNYTKGQHKGSARPDYKRTADPKVILSLTRAMENDFSVQEVGGKIGLGFHNPANVEKALWAEDTYHKTIYGLTPSEKEMAISIADEFINKTFHAS